MLSSVNSRQNSLVFIHIFVGLTKFTAQNTLFFYPTVFKCARIIDLTSGVTIFENSKKASCTFASYRTLLELKSH